MEPNNYTTEYQMLAKFFAGEASPAEAMQIDKWLEKNENKKEFQKSLNIWNTIEPTQRLVLPAAKDAWLQLESTLHAKKKTRKFMLERVIPNPYLIAAILFSIIVTSGIFYFSGQYSTSGNGINKLVTFSSKETNLEKKLPDGSKVVLNKNSTLQYSVNFNTSSRDVTLYGESYFNVVPNKDKPFIISIEGLKVKVIGTSFNVKQMENKKISVQVQSGVVQLLTKTATATVYEGQSGIYNTSDGNLRVVDTIDVNSMSYATKNFSFQNHSLSDVVKLLEEAFRVDIQLEGESLQNCRLTAEFKNKSLDYILQIMTMTINSSYTSETGKIKIYGKGCESNNQ